MVRIDGIDSDARLGVEWEQPNLPGQELVAAERGSGGAKRYLGSHCAPASGAARYTPVGGPVHAAGLTSGRDVEETRILSRGHDPGRGAQHIFHRLQQLEIADRDRSSFLLSLAGWWGSDGNEQGRNDEQHEGSR